MEKNLSLQRFNVTAAYWAATFCEGASRIIIPLYFAAKGVEPSKIGIMFFTYELFSFLMNVGSGFLVNRLGYRMAMLSSLVAHTFASLGYLALDGTQDAFTILLIVNVLRAFRGIGKELIKTTSSAFLKQLKPKGAGKFATAQLMLGGKDGIKGLGLLIGGILLSQLGFVNSFLSLGVATFVCWVGCFFFLDDLREKKQVEFTAFFDVKRKMRLLAFVRAFLYAGRDIWLVLAAPIYLQSTGMDQIAIGGLLAFGFITFGLAQIFGAFIIKSEIQFGPIKKKPIRFRDTLVLTHGLTALVPIVVYLFKDNLTVFMCGVILYNFFAGVATTPHNHLHIKYAKKSRSSIDISYYKSVAHVGKVMAVLISGIIYERWGMPGCALVSFGSLLVAATISLKLRKIAE